MIGIRGADSAIAKALTRMLPTWESWAAVPRGETPPLDYERYFFCQGLLRPKPQAEQTEEEIGESFDVNAHQIIRACDTILAGNTKARICVMGSESGFSGSFDESYASAKGRLHRYVERKQLCYPGQQLVGIAPGIISDTAMTLRREDTEGLEQRRMSHPKRRWLKAVEVARLAHFLLYEDAGYISGTVVRVHGGLSAWR